MDRGSDLSDYFVADAQCGADTAGDCQIDSAKKIQTLNIGGSCATVVSFVVAGGD